MLYLLPRSYFCFFFNDTATTEIYTLSLHDALPISGTRGGGHGHHARPPGTPRRSRDRKSTRLNSSHMSISYAVFCLKKKKNKSKSASMIPKYKQVYSTPFYNTVPSNVAYVITTLSQ